MYIGPSYLGRRSKGDVVTWKFTLTVSDVPTTLGSTPAVKCYQDGSNVEFTGGITLTPDYDGKTGLCELIVDTSNAAYSAGHFYDFVITAGAIGIVSPIGYVVGHFELIPEPADLRAVNGGSTGATAGKLELAQLKVTATGGDDALEINAASGGVAGHFYGDGGGLDIEGTGTFADGIFIQGARYGIDIFVDNNGASGINVQTGNPNFPAVILANQTTGAEVDIAKNDGITIFVGTNGNAITLNSDGIGKAINALGQVYVAPTNTGDDAVKLVGTSTSAALKLTAASNTWVLDVQNTGDGAGAIFNSQRDRGMEIRTAEATDSAFPALYISKQDNGPALYIDGGVDGVWIKSYGVGNALNLLPQGTGKAINALGQLYVAPTNVNDDAIKLVPNGTGLSINAAVESGVDLISSLKLANAANAGKTDGMAGTLVHLRNPADTLNRVTATVDSFGNRTAITLNLT